MLTGMESTSSATSSNACVPEAAQTAAVVAAGLARLYESGAIMRILPRCYTILDFTQAE